jgi:Trk K+ transport system NAD-binding subunit
VIAMRSPDGEIVFNPKGDTTIDAGSILVVVGRREHLDALEKLATGRGRRPV